MAGVDAGEWVVCPSCHTSVLGKSMIPVLDEANGGVRYVCVACARALIVRPAGTPAVAADGADAVVETGSPVAAGAGPDPT